VHAMVNGRIAGIANLATSLAIALAAAGCKERVTSAQCDTLVARYAELVVEEKVPDASATIIETERQREREAAAEDESFKNCSTEVRVDEYRCAMAARTADAFEKCLE
jgi:hypothetical protein